MMTRTLLALGFLLAAGCQATLSPTAADPVACVSGTQVACVCADGSSGEQMCADGRFGACKGCPGGSANGAADLAPPSPDDLGPATSPGDGGSVPSGADTPVATISHYVERVAIDGNTAYAATSFPGGGEIVSANLTNGVVTSLVQNQFEPSPALVDAANIYWSSAPAAFAAHTIWKRPKSGGSATPIAQNLHNVASMQLAGDLLYWVDTNTDPNVGMELVRSSVTAPAPSTLFHLLPTPYLFVQEPIAYSIGGGSKDIFALNLVNAAVNLAVTTAPMAAVGLRADATNLYWWGSATGGVYRAPKAGGSSTLLVPDCLQWQIDSDTIVYSTYQGIFSMPTAGGATKSIVATSANFSLAPGYVYYVTYDSVADTSTVHRVGR